MLAGRERAAHLGAGRGGPVRRRHRRLLPDRPDDPRDLARHRRLQRLPDPAVRPRRRRLVRRAVPAVRGAAATRCPSWCPTGARSPPPTRRRSCGSSCRSPGSPATSSRRCSARPASTWATPSAPTAPARSSSPTPAPPWSAPTPGCSPPPPGARPDGELTYALEGAIFVTGAAVQWLRDGLQIVGSAAETAAIAATVDSTPRAWSSCPALTGLGAPHWDPHARGLIIGLTRGTTRAHIVRATLEAIAFEVRDVLETMPGRGLDLAARRRRRLAPTTCSARSRPTRSAYRWSGRRSSRPPPSALPSWPASAPASGPPPTSCARPGSWTARSSRLATATAADAAHARWQRRRRALEGLGGPGPRPRQSREFGQRGAASSRSRWPR